MVRVGDPIVDTPVTSKPRFSIMLAIRSLASACPLALTNSVASLTGTEDVGAGLGATGLAGVGVTGFVGAGAPGVAGVVVPGLVGVVVPGLTGGVVGGFSPGFSICIQ